MTMRFVAFARGQGVENIKSQATAQSRVGRELTTRAVGSRVLGAQQPLVSRPWGSRSRRKYHPELDQLGLPIPIGRKVRHHQQHYR